MEPSSWITGPEGAAWIAYQRGSQLLERAVNQNLRTTSGVSHPEFEILSRLASAPDGRLRMGALAGLVVAPKSRLNHQIGQLEKRGLVARDPDPADGRGLYATITEAGTKLFQDAVPGLIETVRTHLMTQVSSAELRTVRAVMTRVANSLDSSPVNC